MKLKIPDEDLKRLYSDVGHKQEIVTRILEIVEQVRPAPEMLKEHPDGPESEIKIAGQLSVLELAIVTFVLKISISQDEARRLLGRLAEHATAWIPAVIKEVED